MLSKREKDILNEIIETWDEDDAPLSGGISYAEVFAVLDKLGLKRPGRLSDFLEWANEQSKQTEE